ncbi:hypothetical protein [Actinomadura sp. NTSP31]|uniref:hypothetical protein n=1 Tax=Actinomadura sp. NTSP31 TaxID=1735447 RepID=UPI0035BF06EC
MTTALAGAALGAGAQSASASAPINAPQVTISYSGSNINVHIVDRSVNETGFEVFRLRGTGGTTFPTWQYLSERDSTPADVTGQGAVYDILITNRTVGPQCFTIAAYNDSTATVTDVQCLQ